MQITVDIPDELAQHFDCSQQQLSRQILEALVVRAYQTEQITHAEVGRILDLPSRWAVDAFLKANNADLLYDSLDLEQDRETLKQLGISQFGQSNNTASGEEKH
ncbi:MAG: UPF0175 family protein [Leptolyngbya sp. SIO4C1]|nr:UPF0175 family protein [Leptolyngbya sp. SIO4C1]